MGGLLGSNAFAWTISILLHAGLFIAFYKMGFSRAVAERRLIIPEARLVAGPAQVTPPSGLPRKLTEPTPAPDEIRAPHLSELPILSVAAVDATASDVVVSGPPMLTLPGMDSAGSGLGTTSSGSGMAVGPVSRFFGQAGNAYRIVYVVDISGSLMHFMDDIVREMQGSIRDLLPTQEFHIVAAMPLQVREMEPRRLVPANARYKAMAHDMIKFLASNNDRGEPDPIEAMKRAFAVGPELIYFLSDGYYSRIDADLLATLKQLNSNQQVKITVIGIGWSAENVPGEPVPRPKVLLEQIAREHGGHCRFVDK